MSEQQPASSSQMPVWIPRLLVYVLLTVGAGIAIYNSIRALRGLITILLVALFVSFALEPAVNWLASHGWRRGVATFAILAGLAALSVAFLASFIPLFLAQLRSIVDAAPGWLNQLNVYTHRWFGIDVSTANIQERLRNFDASLASYARNVAGNVFGIVTGVLSLVFELLTIALFSFFMIAEGPRLRHAVCSILPPRRQEEVLRAWEIGIEKTGGYVYSRLLLAAISGATAFVVFVAVGVPFPFALALWIGLVSQFIPTVGTYIAAVVPLVVTLFERGTVSAIIVLVYILIYQQIENYLLSPRVTAHTMELHPAVAFGSVIAGASLFGATGAFLALPATATLQSGLSVYIRRHEVVESQLTEGPPPPPPKKEGWSIRLAKRIRRKRDAASS